MPPKTPRPDSPLIVTPTERASLVGATRPSLAPRRLGRPFRKQPALSVMPPRQAIDWGLTGKQLEDAFERYGYLAVGRPQLTWRVIGFAEALGLRIEQLQAVTDTRAEGLQVFWRGEAPASARAWRETERLLELPRRATHYSLNAPALALIANSSGSIEIGELLKAQRTKIL
jgi:hypothetical protein